MLRMPQGDPSSHGAKLIEALLNTGCWAGHEVCQIFEAVKMATLACKNPCPTRIGYHQTCYPKTVPPLSLDKFLCGENPLKWTNSGGNKHNLWAKSFPTYFSCWLGKACVCAVWANVTTTCDHKHHGQWSVELPNSLCGRASANILFWEELATAVLPTGCSICTLQFLLMAFHTLRILFHQGMTRDCPKVLTQFGRSKLAVVFWVIFERMFLNRLFWISSRLPSPFQSNRAKIVCKQTLKKYVIQIFGKRSENVLHFYTRVIAEPVFSNVLFLHWGLRNRFTAVFSRTALQNVHKSL